MIVLACCCVDRGHEVYHILVICTIQFTFINDKNSFFMPLGTSPGLWSAHFSATAAIIVEDDFVIRLCEHLLGRVQILEDAKMDWLDDRLWRHLLTIWLPHIIDAPNHLSSLDDVVDYVLAHCRQWATDTSAPHCLDVRPLLNMTDPNLVQWSGWSEIVNQSNHVTRAMTGSFDTVMPIQISHPSQRIWRRTKQNIEPCFLCFKYSIFKILFQNDGDQKAPQQKDLQSYELTARKFSLQIHIYC